MCEWSKMLLRVLQRSVVWCVVHVWMSPKTTSSNKITLKMNRLKFDIYILRNKELLCNNTYLQLYKYIYIYTYSCRSNRRHPLTDVRWRWSCGACAAPPLPSWPRPLATASVPHTRPPHCLPPSPPPLQPCPQTRAMTAICGRQLCRTVTVKSFTLKSIYINQVVL